MIFLARAPAALALLAALFSSACNAREPGQAFDYYVLSLSWSPEYCAETRRSDEPQCVRPYAFVAHGLWPQNERGYPKDCQTRERVDDSTIARLLPIMPSRSLVIHEWRTHGACSGLDAEAYFSTVERAYHSIRIPERYRGIGDYLTVDAQTLKQDFIAANPQIAARGLVLQCSGHYLQEVRVCLDTRLAPRACGSDLRDHCGADLVLRPVR